MIDHNWLTNLNDLIKQRIASQNEGQSISFSASMYYANGRVVRLEDEQSFINFNDARAELSVGVDVKWSFLIKFPISDVPEKQEIRFRAFTDTAIMENMPHRESAALASFTLIFEDHEKLSYNIEFSNVTCGEDISAMIDGYILSKTTQTARFRSIFNRISAISAFVIAGLLMITLFMGVLISQLSTSIDALEKKYGDLQQLANGLKTDSQKTQFLVDNVIFRMQYDRVSYVPFAQILLILLAFTLLFLLVTIRERSAVILNDFSLNANVTSHKRYEFIKYTLIVGGFVGITSGVFANNIIGIIISGLGFAK